MCPLPLCPGMVGYGLKNITNSCFRPKHENEENFEKEKQ